MDAVAYTDAVAAASTDAALEAVAPALYAAAMSHPHGSAAIPSTITPSIGEPKKTGRPAHPLWAHFHRGEKRNRYHYHSYCIYCVERYGAAHVTATRGVSIDMLRHLEKCTNCPRHIVEQVKEICGRRDALRYDRTVKKKQVHEASTPSSSPSSTRVAQTAGQAAPSTTATTSVRIGSFGSTMTSSAASASIPVVVQLQNTIPPSTSLVRTAVSDVPSPQFTAKRPRTDSGSVASPVAPSTPDHKLALLKLAVAAGFSPECFENTDVQQLIAMLRPALQSPTAAADVFNGLNDPEYLKEMAAQLAAIQLDRVKEGMLNSTIKGGLTLSLHSWITLDGQHLVAFNLINSNGDAACVCVEDIALIQPTHAIHATPGTLSMPYTSFHLAAKIEDVLAKLQSQNISVMGIVADSTLALNAARQVAAASPARHALLVVPCFARLLSVLAGAVLTHAHFVGVVSEMIEISSYLLNVKVLAALRSISNDPHASFVLPNKENWFSFVECHTHLMQSKDAIVKLCQTGLYTTPHVLKTLVLRDNQAIWKKLIDLGKFLAPLKETYNVFFQLSGRPETDEPSEFVEDDIAAAHGLTLAHVMYQFARMMQQYQTLLLQDPSIVSSPALQDVAQLVLIYVDTMWRRYELPAMLLAFVFNFHLDTSLLDMAKPCSSWPSIAQYFQVYYQRWFGDATHSAASGHVAITRERIAEILDAIKLNQFPFDADTTSDYMDVSSFYSFVSDTHPEICALCCRLYAISLFTANAPRIIKGIGYVPNAAQTTREPDAVETLLHFGFAASLRRSAVGVSGSALGGMTAMADVYTEAVLWGEDLWQGFAEDWRLFVDQELLMDEFDAISNASASTDATAAMLAVKVPVQELFADTLSPVSMTLEPPAAPHGVEDGGASAGVISVGI